jgi:hypothetical protein
MSPLAKLHSHPDLTKDLPGRTPGAKSAKVHVYGYLLESGDELEATDVYSSSNGQWEPCPCPGTKLAAGLAVMWVRPT